MGVEWRCQRCQLERVVHSLGRVWRGGFAAKGTAVAVAGAFVYVVDEEGILHGIQLADGIPAWRPVPLGGVARGMIVEGNRLYIALRRSSELVAVDGLTGEVRWRYQTMGNCGNLLWHNGKLWFGDGAGWLHVVADGGDKPVVEQKRQIVQQPISHAPVWQHNRLIVVTRSRDSALLRLNRQWQSHVLSTLRRERSAELIPLKNDVILSGLDRTVVRIETRTGKEVWRVRVDGGGIIGRISTKTHLYIATRDDFLHTLDLKTGKTVSKQRLPASFRGMMLWNGLLIVATDQGLMLFDAANGERLTWVDAPVDGCCTAPAVDEYGNIFVGREDGGVLALPWHWRERWAWAADWCKRRGNWQAEAALAVRGNRLLQERAARIWETHEQWEQSAEMHLAFGEIAHAAAAFEEAGFKIRGSDKATAAQFFNKAADCHAELNNFQEQERVSRLASKLGRFAHLQIEAFNLPTIEAGKAGKIALRLRNSGNGDAHNLRFLLGGELAQTVRGTFEIALPTKQTLDIEFENIIPTRWPQQKLRVAFYFEGGRKVGHPVDKVFMLNVSTPPDLELNDVGAVKISVPHGERIPRVRINGDVGLVKIEQG